MALCWIASVQQLDSELVFAPERYSAKRKAQASEMQDTIALGEIASLIRLTINPAHGELQGKEFLVLDTTHAVEGRVLFSGKPVKGREVGSVKRPLKAGNVMVSRLRTYLRQVALIDDDLLERYGAHPVCSTEFYVLEPAELGSDIAFLVPYLLSEPVQEIFKNAQEGGHHPRIHHSVLMELRVPVRLLEMRDRLSKEVRQFIEAIRQGERIFSKCANEVAAGLRFTEHPDIRKVTTTRDLAPMAQYLIWAMEGWGMMTNDVIYQALKRVSHEHGRQLPDHWESHVREILQTHCPSRPQWNGKDDFFVYHGRGHWSCKVTSSTLEQLCDMREVQTGARAST
jgi:hypothetical protein